MKMGLVGLYQPRFDADRWLDSSSEQRPTLCFLVPALAELHRRPPRLRAADLSSLRQVSIGERAARARRPSSRCTSGCPRPSVGNSYGMTEAGPAFI